jgi:hypothetical protein
MLIVFLFFFLLLIIIILSVPAKLDQLFLPMSTQLDHLLLNISQLLFFQLV